jgi:hypothetical protein
MRKCSKCDGTGKVECSGCKAEDFYPDCWCMCEDGTEECGRCNGTGKVGKKKKKKKK